MSIFTANLEAGEIPLKESIFRVTLVILWLVTIFLIITPLSIATSPKEIDRLVVLIVAAVIMMALFGWSFLVMIAELISGIGIIIVRGWRLLR